MITPCGAIWWVILREFGLSITWMVLSLLYSMMCWVIVPVQEQSQNYQKAKHTALKIRRDGIRIDYKNLNVLTWSLLEGKEMSTLSDKDKRNQRLRSGTVDNAIFHMSSVTQHWLTQVPVGASPFNHSTLMGWQTTQHLYISSLYDEKQETGGRDRHGKGQETERLSWQGMSQQCWNGQSRCLFHYSRTCALCTPSGCLPWQCYLWKLFLPIC